jgi:hypothetical protein
MVHSRLQQSLQCRASRTQALHSHQARCSVLPSFWHQQCLKNPSVCAGILRTLMFYPLDFSRTRLTADTTPKGQPRPYTSITSCLRHAWAREGILSWYKGMGMSLPGVMVYTSISFTAYDTFKVRVHLRECYITSGHVASIS